MRGSNTALENIFAILNDMVLIDHSFLQTFSLNSVIRDHVKLFGTRGWCHTLVNGNGGEEI